MSDPSGGPEEGAPASPPDQAPVLRAVAMPADTNPEGDIFGGWLMSQMDLAASTIAFGLARGRCATVSVERVTFLSPVFVGDEVSMHARPLRVGRTSVRVGVEAWRRRRDGGASQRAATGEIVYVAIDEHRRPRPLDSAGPGPVDPGGG